MRLLFPALAAVSFATGCAKPPAKPVSPTPAPEPTKVASSIRFEDVTKSSGVCSSVNGAAGRNGCPRRGLGVAR